MKSSAAKTGRAKPRRGMIGIASHAATPEGLRNGWERSGQGEACRRYAISARECRVPKGTPVTATNLPAIAWLATPI